jgi:hypothetical protein
LSPFALETTGGHGASTATVYSLFAKQLRDSGLPADALVGTLKKDISFALRRGTIAQVTTALDAAQRAVEYESALVWKSVGERTFFLTSVLSRSAAQRRRRRPEPPTRPQHSARL